MKKHTILIAILCTMTFILIACNDDSEKKELNDESENNQTENVQENEVNSTDDSEETETKSNHSDRESLKDDIDHSTDQAAEKEEDVLSKYSSEEIEYARVWMALGENQDLDQLYAERIPAGVPLNVADETSLEYPEDVVQLSGTRLIDGVVTYSSNGDGTVNVYHVPKRWDGKNPAGEEVYQQIIDDTDQESIDPGQDEAVEELIKKLEINE